MVDKWAEMMVQQLVVLLAQLTADYLVQRKEETVAI